MITNYGYAIIASTTLALFIGYFLNLAWVYLFSLVVLLVIVLDSYIFYKDKRKLLKLNIEKEYNEFQLQGQPFEIVVNLINRNRSAIHLLLIKNEIPYGFKLSKGSLIYFGSVSPGNLKFSYTLVPYQTGLHNLGELELTLYDPLMIFSYKKKIGNTNQVKVIPKLTTIQRTNILSNMISIISTHVRRKRGFGLEFYSIREYEYGDEIKNIAWRAVASSPERKLFTIQRIEELKSKFTIIIDVSKTMNDGIEKYRKIDALASQVCSFAKFVLEKNDDLLLVFFSKEFFKEIELKRKEDLSDLMKFFAELKPVGDKNFEALSSLTSSKISNETQAILITDFELSGSDIEYLKEISMKRNLNIVFFDILNFIPYDSILKSLIDYKLRKNFSLEKALSSTQSNSFFVYDGNLIYPLLRAYLSLKMNVSLL